MIGIVTRRRAISLSVLLSVAAAGSAYGQSTFLPYASETYEHNSNVFALPNSSAALIANGDPRLSDSDLKTVAGFEEDYLWDRQKLYATLEGRYFHYQHFDELTHYESLAKAGLDWKLFSFVDGTFLGSFERYMASFANRDTTTALAINLDKNGIAKFNFRISPEWRLETSATYHSLDAPVQGFPNYGLSETTGLVALKYSGFSDLTYGISADYVNGSFRNAPSAGSYIQRDIDLTATYKATGLSSFDGMIGHTTRDQGLLQGSTSAFTGKVDYLRQLSGKTALEVGFMRAVNSYIGSGGSELDSTANVTLNYHVTYKTSMSFAVSETWSTFTGQTIAGPGAIVAGRKDKSPAASFKLNYQATRWVLIQPYASYARRNSNVDFYDYSGTIVGVEVLVRKPAPPTH